MRVMAGQITSSMAGPTRLQPGEQPRQRGLRQAFHLHWKDASARWSGTGRKVETDNSGHDVTVAHLNKSFCNAFLR